MGPKARVCDGRGALRAGSWVRTASARKDSGTSRFWRTSALFGLLPAGSTQSSRACRTLQSQTGRAEPTVHAAEPFARL
ncbi:unnamed protein product [Rangifer tarandus platyrhynchus]|uniref:Uncharacterized protein n=1 Tax=Rangifer tarandus platyrhynchus TaxID=3082113 RepID=A0ABN8YEY3_RANTA|nr:unnamed protein product [Rangifer tarandus platyrhynchus]